MTVIQSVLLGILQGITEFLPISSSGHLIIAKHFIDGVPDIDLLYDVMLHVATLLAVLLFFRKRVVSLIKAFFGIFFESYNKYYFENKRFLIGIIVASIPTGVIGLYFDKYVYNYFSNIAYIGYALIFTSLILIFSDRFNGKEDISAGKSIILGIVQGLAVIPGISRSGSTIGAGLMLGIKREEIMEFSFLMSVPAILGAAILQIRHVESVSLSLVLIYFLGMVSAFISGILAICLLKFFVSCGKLKFFAFYCLIAGIISVIII